MVVELKEIFEKLVYISPKNENSVLHHSRRVNFPSSQNISGAKQYWCILLTNLSKMSKIDFTLIPGFLILM